MFVEKSGLGPFDTVRIEVKPDGAVEVITGVASLGQGVETVIAQICADALGVDYANIRVIHGQTDRIDKGMGAFASRVTVMCGEATRLAATKLRDKAAHRRRRTDANQSRRARYRRRANCSYGRRRRAVDAARRARARAPAGLSAEDTFESAHMVYPYGVHVAAVRVDADTGGVTIERYVIAYDIGKAVNPKLVEGQIAGGLAQGIGGALLEEFLYDENGEPLSVTFADYLMPTAREMPEVSILITEDAPSPLNPLGLKGAGEGGANPVGAVIASAIDDALGMPRRGDATADLAAAAEGDLQKDLTMASEGRPQLKAPPGACDTHMHIYDRRFPKAATAKIDPPDASVADYLAMRARLGIERTVVVQPSTYGKDNRCTLEAMAAIGPSARGVAVVDETVTDAELERLTKLGIRGIRFFMLAGRPAALGDSRDRWRRGSRRSAGMCSFNSTAAICPTMRRCFKRLAATLAIDHVGKFLEPVAPDHPGFRTLLRLLDNGRTWIKLAAPYETSKVGPPFTTMSANSPRRWSKPRRSGWSGRPTGRTRRPA